MKISIVIPTYNEEKTILKKLENTLDLNYPKKDMELIVVDCSDDRTPNIVEERLGGRGEIRLILDHEEERRGLPYSLNKGYSMATGDIVVKTDCDAMLDRDALKSAVSSFEEDRIGCVTGRAVPMGSRSEEIYRGLNMKIQLLESRIDSTIIAHGPFTAFRRPLLQKIDEDSLADDSELSLKIRRQGYRSILNPEVIFYEKTSEEGREEQKTRRASGLVRLMWRNKTLFLNPKYGLYGLLVFPFNFTAIVILPLLLSPLLLPMMKLGVRGGTLLETEQFLLRGMGRLLSKRATVFWEPDANIRG
ncbi:Glycosyl transferase family 2 [Methanothrix harundinacea 6Ac]|uniref:Glycosyl transferase family 2 n=1 Tax=Methanothrix harundinacea (strain 6Ac) TaxID=1110509 RepID=G7WR71_METH6|nr:Glycosyl transferase family 2 [Methanothrix harundinacea 6Ac]